MARLQRGLEPVMKKPLVGIVMGSTSDWEVMQHAARQLKDFGVAFEARALSAQRTPDALIEWVETMAKGGAQCFIAGAGGAAQRVVQLLLQGIFLLSQSLRAPRPASDARTCVYARMRACARMRSGNDSSASDRK